MTGRPAGPLRLLFTPQFRRARRKKPPELRRALDAKVERLRTNPGHPSLRVKRIRGGRFEGIWEASVNMSSRFTFQFASDGASIILRNCNGHDVFRAP